MIFSKVEVIDKFENRVDESIPRQSQG